MAIDQTRLEEFMWQFAADFGAALHASTVVLGNDLGLYRALADNGPTDAATVAAVTGCDTRLVQAWLDAQYVSGYCHFSAQTDAYWLSPEQAAVLADAGSPAFLVAGMTIATATAKEEEKIGAAFRAGTGPLRHEHHRGLLRGTERPVELEYATDVASEWIRALDGVTAKLASGGSVADVACGYGGGSILLARAHPSTTITGFDAHAASIDVARARVAEAGIADRVHFEVASAHDFPGTGYDLVCVLDAFCDLGDPQSAARHIRDALAPNGTWLLVESMAGERVEYDVNAAGRIFGALSALTPSPAVHAPAGKHAERSGSGVDACRHRGCSRILSAPPRRANAALPRLRTSPIDTEVKEKTMSGIEISDFSTPDEVRRPDHTTIEVVKIADGEVGRYTFQPGWRWSEHIKPIVGTESCQTNHIGYVVSGKLEVRSDDGSSGIVSPGCVYRIAPGHDAHVVGNEPVIVVEFQGAASYAKS